MMPRQIPGGKAIQHETSLGGTYCLNDHTTRYGDVQRSLGSDWHKKWQGNIGINWQF